MRNTIYLGRFLKLWILEDVTLEAVEVGKWAAWNGGKVW